MKPRTQFIVAIAGIVAVFSLGLVAAFLNDAELASDDVAGMAGGVATAGETAEKASSSLDKVARSLVRAGADDSANQGELAAANKIMVGRAYDLETELPVIGAQIHWAGRYAVTDRDGLFDLGNHIAPNQEAARLHAVHPDYVDTSLSPEGALFTEAGIGIPMVRGVIIEGYVRDASGKPIARATVVASDSGGMEALPMPVRESLWEGSHVRFESSASDSTARTDDSGHYRLSALLASTDAIEVVASRGSYVRARNKVMAQDTGSQVSLDFLLDRGASVAGKVTVNGVSVDGSVSWMANDARGSAGIRSDGSYKLRGVPEGLVTIRAQPKCGPLAAREKTFEVQAGADLFVDFTILEPTETISGRVTNERGEAVADALVSVRGRVPEKTRVRGRSDEGGHYGIALCAREGTRFRVSGYHDSSSTSLDDVPLGTTDADLVIPTMGVVRLRVVGAVSGRPVTGFDVCVRRPGRKYFSPKVDLDDVDGEGHASFRAPRERIEIMVQAARGGYIDERVADVIPASESDAMEHTVLMHRGASLKINWVGDISKVAPRNRVLAILDEEQATVMEVRVGVASEGMRLTQCTWNGNCQFGPNARINAVFDMKRLLEVNPRRPSRVRGLAAGTYHLKLWPDDIAFTPDSIHISGVDELDVDVRFGPRSQ